MPLPQNKSSEEKYEDILKKLDSFFIGISKIITPSVKIYTNSALKEHLGVSYRTLANWRSEVPPRIEFSQIGSKIYYTQQNVDDFLENHRVGSPK